MHPWAGAGWGFQFIPRIGMEVVVVFEGGDPDKPLVTGCVYNGVLPPPFPLPGDKTISGIRTRSTPHAQGNNELSFQDAAGRERIYLHAQRDHDTVVERNRTAAIRHDDATLVDAAQTLTVRGTQTSEIIGDRTTTMRHDDHLRVEGSRHVSVRQNLDEVVYGNRSVHVHEKDRREVAGEAEEHVRGDLITRVDGNATMLVGKHDAQRSATVVVEGPMQVSAEKVIDLVSEKEVILRCGKSFIRIGPNEIEIGGPKVTVRGKDARLQLANGMAKTKTKTGYQVVSDGGIALCGPSAGLRLKAQFIAEGTSICLNSPARVTDNIEIDEVEPTVVELKDQEGQPIPYQRFRIICDDGSEYMGFVDQDGTAEADIESGGRIVFPDLSDVEDA
jgi:type VI secretion system secreted protein VgrG